MIYENLLIACLRTGDDVSAFEFLERLVERFGGENERIMAFKGLAKEAKAANNAELEELLKEYDSLLSGQDGQTNIVGATRSLIRRTATSPLDGSGNSVFFFFVYIFPLFGLFR